MGASLGTAWEALYSSRATASITLHPSVTVLDNLEPTALESLWNIFRIRCKSTYITLAELTDIFSSVLPAPTHLAAAREIFGHWTCDSWAKTTTIRGSPPRTIESDPPQEETQTLDFMSVVATLVLISSLSHV